MKIKLGQCKCGALVYLAEDAGLKWVGDMERLDAQEAVRAALAGRELYRVQYVGATPTELSTAKPDVLKALVGEPGERPIVVGSHGCPTNACKALSTPLVAPEPTPCPKGRENGAQGPARGTPAGRATQPPTSSMGEVPSNDRDAEAVMIIQTLLGATVVG